MAHANNTVDLSADTSRLKAVDYGERSMGNILSAVVKYSDFVASTDAVKLIPVPANSFVCSLYFIVTTAFDGTSVLIVGDDEDPNGYLVAGEIPETDTTVAADAVAANAAGLYVVKSDDSTSGRRFYTSADTIDVELSWSSAPTAGEGVLIVELVTVP